MNINLLLVVVAVAFLVKMAGGYKKGLVRQVLSLISLVVLCVVVALIANGVHSYFDGDFMNVTLIVILMILVGIAHHFLGLVLFPAKLVTKLPIIKFVDKLLGIVFGAVEVVFLLWTIYTFIMMMEVGPIEEIILSYTEENPLLTWFYQNNYLARWIEHLLEEFSFVPLR